MFDNDIHDNTINTNIVYNNDIHDNTINTIIVYDDDTHHMITLSILT